MTRKELIDNVIDNLYELQKNEYLSTKEIILINDIVGTLQYKIKNNNKETKWLDTIKNQ